MTTLRGPPFRPVRGTKLNTIPEDLREFQDSDQHHANQAEQRGRADQKDEACQSGFNPIATLGPRLKLKTTNLPPSSSMNRFLSPMSAGSISSCSDTEWQRQMEPFDELYDATDDESDLSDDCTSISTSTRPTSLATPTTRHSLTSPVSRNRYPRLKIPSHETWPSLHGAPKSSPVPPTPPSKIPVSPAALSLLSHAVPAAHAPPSLDGGSVSSDQVSNISAPATPDLQSLTDADWEAQDVHIRSRIEDDRTPDVSDREPDSDVQDIEIALESPDEDWQRVLGNFPSIPGRSIGPPAHIEAGPSREHTPSDNGVFLPEGAMATLRHIPLDRTPDPWSEGSDADEEMWEVHGIPERPRSAGDATPASAISGHSFSSLSIPSPGGFFASLGPRARHTWSIPKGAMPPSSAVAERFYNLPFGRDEGEIVEQVIECRDIPTEDQPTAVYAPPTAIRLPPKAESHAVGDQRIPISPGPGGISEISRPVSTNNLDEQDETYEEELQKRAMASLDRTSVWLAAQQSYLSALRESNPVNLPDIASESEADESNDVAHQERPNTNGKRAVRFAQNVPDAPSSAPSASASRDSIYWRGFQSVRQLSSENDTFLHRHMRFDAVQSIRLGLPNLHVKCLQGYYELDDPGRPPYKGPFAKAPRNSVIASELAEKAQFSMIEKEQSVLAQLSQSMWAMDALKYINGGHLLTSPAAKRLSSSPSSKGRRRCIRVLDLGGHASCEWAWQLANDHSNVKVYTVYTERQAVNPGIKGPDNHRQVAVSQLWKLPFPDNKFDVISARSLPAFLKAERPANADQDEYDLCLQECRRCLKPGGYLEYFVMDAEVAQAGPYATATSVEFAFSLKTRGYDPIPTKSFLGRLRKGGFEGIKRAWTFLPMGVEPAPPQVPRETPEPRVKSQIEAYEAVHGPIGSTADIASVAGLFGGWIWEQWLLKLQMEMGRKREKLLEGVGAVFDEGRKNSAGWTCLTGWAMKPKR